MITVVTGIRDLDPTSYADVEMTILDELHYADEIRFGGALGVDTVALETTLEYRSGTQPRLRVFVPFDVAAQPRDTRRSIAAADEVVELRLPRSRGAYLRRNAIMLNGADRVLAFSDGRTSGGTWFTSTTARQRGLWVVQIDVDACAVRANPWLPKRAAQVFAYRRYVSARHGERELTSEVVRRMKAGTVHPDEVEWLADELCAVVKKESLLRQVDVVVPMPRRIPTVQSDLLPLARELAERMGIVVLDTWLTRVGEPVGGSVKAYRLRFRSDEHARTMRVTQPATGRVLLLDNVLTTGGTMDGAIQAVQRDSPECEPIGFAILYSETF